jgi:AcrR family transcriptional regulator
MGTKAGLSPELVHDAAAAIADKKGLDAVTLASVAETLGIRSPSLYVHVAGLQGLKRELALRGAGELEDVLRDAAEHHLGVDALRRILHAYRAFATERPGLYDALQRSVRPGTDGELDEALGWLLEPVEAALTQAGVSAAERVHLMRAFRAAVHGFVTLEQSGAFGLGRKAVDESFRRLVELLIAGVTSR